MTPSPEFSERLARIRARQASMPDLTPEQIREAIDRPFREHGDHPWHAVGRCVYCGSCGVRLYQGTIPPGHALYTPPPKPSRGDELLRQRRERYGA